MDVGWRGGDVARFPGGGHKVNMLRPVIDQWKDEENLVLLFVDRYIYIYTHHSLKSLLSSSLYGVAAAMMWSSRWDLIRCCRSFWTLTVNWSSLLSHSAGLTCR